MSEKYQIIYSPQALDDLKGIYAYIAFSLNTAATARKQVGRIRSEISSLSTMPERYALVQWEPWYEMGLRKMTVNNFVVFYLVEKEERTVTVVRILYGGMDIDAVFQESVE